MSKDNYFTNLKTKTSIVDGITMGNDFFKPSKIVLRMSKTGEHITFSLCDEEVGIMIQIKYSDLLKLRGKLDE